LLYTNEQKGGEPFFYFVSLSILYYTIRPYKWEVNDVPKNNAIHTTRGGRMEEREEPADETYQMRGYENRQAYLAELADDYGIDTAVVAIIADTLGPREDFDGLISSLEDFSYLDVFA
jgi:hypothetical protein